MDVGVGQSVETFRESHIFSKGNQSHEIFIASERSERAYLVVSRARFFYIYTISTGTALRNCNSNFAMRVNFITRTFHAAALARNNVKHCTSKLVLNKRGYISFHYEE